MQTCSVTKFKDQALGILEQIAETGEPAIVTKRGKAIVKVIPYRAQVSEDAAVPMPGKLKGTVLEEVDIVSPLGAGVSDVYRSDLG